MSWYVYILLCDQKTYYIGLTHDLQQRFNSHTHKQNHATKEFTIIKLVYHEVFKTRHNTEKREQQLKRWTFAKKKALVDGNKELLIKLSKTRSLLKDNS